MLASPRPAHEDCFAHHHQPPVLVSHLDHAAAATQQAPTHTIPYQLNPAHLSLTHTLRFTHQLYTNL